MKQFLIKLRILLLSNYLYNIILLFTIMYLIIYINSYNPKYKYSLDETNFVLSITNYYIDNDKLSIELKGKENIVGTFYFDSVEDGIIFKSEYSLGDKISVIGMLSIPKNNTIPNTFNYKRYLLYKRTNYILSIESINKISSNKNIFIKIKNKVISIINNIDNNEYLYAFILGNSKYLSNEVSNNYKLNTITHLFALSGLHVSIFASILSIIFKKTNSKSRLIIIFLFLLFICFISSFTPSIVRASIFYILLNLNEIYYTYIKPKNILFITFSIMILINPFYIYNLGFVLSFTITYFLLLSGEFIKVNNRILSLLSSSLISFLASFPIIINNFYKINLIGFINNIFFIPYVSSVVYPFSLLTFIFNFLSPILKMLTGIMEFVSKISTRVLNLNITFPKMSIIEIIVFYVLLISLIKYKKKIIIFLIIFLLIILYNKEIFNKKTCMYFIDVGQGDSILIKTKNNKTILIDTGGKETYYKQIKRNKEYNLMNDTMIPFFNSIGIRKIDYLILTHGDSDHLGYSSNLIENMKVDNIFINKGDINYLESKLKNNILLDNYIKIDNIDIYSLNDKIYNNENDDSIILLIKIYNYNILLMGDASIRNEKNILEKYNIPELYILKLGHHGSDTSTSEELLINTKPKYSIISASKNNKYNHPSINTINKLNKYNLTYYETSKTGTIKFCFNDKSVKQNTYIS